MTWSSTDLRSLALAAIAGLIALALTGAADARSRSCGGAHHAKCAADQYCQLSDKVCHASRAIGVCKPKPQMCPDVFITVCGCDGKVYANDCQANRAGIAVAHAGKCRTSDTTANHFRRNSAAPAASTNAAPAVP